MTWWIPIIMKRVLLVLTIALCFSYAQAQRAVVRERPKYKNAIGLRYHPLGVSYKNFFKTRNRAVELISYFSEGFRMSAFYQFHGNLNGLGNFKWYVGLGAHGGYYDRRNISGVTAGVDAVGGLDYKFLRAPINISVDWQPSLEFIKPEFGFQSRYGGVAVRFAF